MLQSFDAPVMDVNCERRPVSTVATQSLILMNGEFALQQAELLADRVIREAHTVAVQVKDLPELPKPKKPEWSYGYGTFDEATGCVVDFKPLPHWTGGEWQGSAARPDAEIGWVILNAGGGHPGGKFAAIRRWTAPVDGRVRITGTLKHASESGDGVRGRLVSDRQGVLGVWECANTSMPTHCDAVQVMAGESIDFVTDCRTTENADSFTWSARFDINDAGGVELRPRDSEKEFHGPTAEESFDGLVAQVQQAWTLAYSRTPTDEELRLSVGFVAHQLRELQADPSGVAAGSTVGRQVLVNFCHALLNSNEFVYVD